MTPPDKDSHSEVAYQHGRSNGYCRALLGIKSNNPYILSNTLSSKWHKGYRAGLIEGGRKLEKGGCL